MTFAVCAMLSWASNESFDASAALKNFAVLVVFISMMMLCFFIVDNNTNHNKRASEERTILIR